MIKRTGRPDIAKQLRKKLVHIRAQHKQSKRSGPPVLSSTGMTELPTFQCSAPNKPPSLALAMITADRPGHPTIHSSLISLRAAGFKQAVHIFTEAGSVSDKRLLRGDPKLMIFRQKTITGCFPNWKRCATWMLSNTVAEWIMIMQDDISWCTAGQEIMAHTLNCCDRGVGIPRYRLGVLSPYTSPAMVSPAATGYGWTEARFYGKTTSLWGALALCFPRESLDKLLKNKRFIEHDSVRALDYVVGDTFRNHMEPPMGVKVHMPSLVDHTGDNSTIFTPQATKINRRLMAMRRGYKYSNTAAWRTMGE